MKERLKAVGEFFGAALRRTGREHVCRLMVEAGYDIGPQEMDDLANGQVQPDLRFVATFAQVLGLEKPQVSQLLNAAYQDTCVEEFTRSLALSEAAVSHGVSKAAS